MAKIDPAKSAIPLSPTADDLTGRIFGRLEVQGFAGRDASGRLLWSCRCLNDGNSVMVYGENLRRGATQSCGCIHREKTGDVHRKHGQSKTLAYSSWRHMIVRCTDETHPSYRNYGGRGIKVCERWLNSFEAFLADMGERPSKKHSIDRYPNGDGDYEPGNCRWATRAEQNASRRFRVPRKDARLYEYNGELLSAGRLAEIAGVPYHVMDNRLRAGWSAEKSVNTPVRPRGPNRSKRA